MLEAKNGCEFSGDLAQTLPALKPNPASLPDDPWVSSTPTPRLGMRDVPESVTTQTVLGLGDVVRGVWGPCHTSRLLENSRFGGSSD